jgi:uncharacterized protein (UPF0332 family)
LALHDDLLRQARRVANNERSRPRQVSLRRALSAAYYALFHLLIAEATRVLAPARPVDLRAQFGRAFGHEDMRRVCLAFNAGDSGSLPAATRRLISAPIRSDLAVVAATFVDLHTARHTADYDISAVFERDAVLAAIDSVEAAFAQWNGLRDEPNTNVFLIALLLQSRWSRAS